MIIYLPFVPYGMSAWKYFNDLEIWGCGNLQGRDNYIFIKNICEYENMRVFGVLNYL